MKCNLGCCPSAGATVLQRSLKIKSTKEEEKIVWASDILCILLMNQMKDLGKNGESNFTRTAEEKMPRK